MPTFSLYWHQNKERPLHDALISRGWDFVQLGKPADLLLINHDMPQGDQRKSIDLYANMGAKIVTYPEGSGLYAYWDGIREPYRVDACLVIADGYKATMDAWNLNVPIHSIGWLWSDIKDFTPTTGNKVLFAPIHPDGFGVLEPGDIVWNRTVYERLIRIPNIELTVRYLGMLAQNGLWTMPKVTFKRGVYNNANDDIEAHDLIVSSGTFAAKAIAMGKPTVTFPVPSGETIYRYAKHYEDYREFMKFPLEISNPDDLSQAMQHARSYNDLQEWKDNWIGKPFDADNLDKILRGVLNG